MVVQRTVGVAFHDSVRAVELLVEVVVLHDDLILGGFGEVGHSKLHDVVASQVANEGHDALVGGQHVGLQVEQLDVVVQVVVVGQYYDEVGQSQSENEDGICIN